MRKFCGVLLLVFLAAAGAEVKLAKPQASGGEGIFTLLEKRASGLRIGFPTGAVSDQELSTILWAATGRNRNGKGWTVPVGMGRPPHVKVYAVKNDGAFLYDWQKHALTEVNPKNVKAEVTADGFVRNSSVILVFVADTAANKRAEMDNILVGAMSQNVYLAANALGVTTRYLMTLNADGIRKELKLNKTDLPLCIMPLAK
ncbi:nitroreductase superfamily protein [Candidatus Termititenax aidoneus]|uniref:Nitroreductase superfamily protein n=1 Tax=Termititenax aidoneus TaxID=2218524 RepID=A0A388TBQ7_TERA1|nr:nitroreductase superfamily protein [Candidatus Termititenax aidoneus]